MSVFTPITEAQLHEFLFRYSLGQLISFSGIEAGTDNSNFFVTTTQGEYVLTLFENLTDRELPFFLNLGDHLKARNCKIAQPMHDKAGDALQVLADKPAVLFEKLAGRHVVVPSQDHCSQMGRAMGEFHTAVQELSIERRNPFGLNWLMAHRQYQHWMETEDHELFNKTLDQLEQLNDMDLPTGIIHADLFHDNALFKDDHLSGVIDWYFACNDYLLLDLAIMINDWCRHGLTFDQNRIDAMIHSYQSKRRLTADERRAMVLMRKLAVCRFWLSRTLAWNDLKDRQLEQVTVKSPNEMKALLKIL
ncbi:homoserine kinase [Gynuella sunshinyii]|nr:homoserine kinase [Gynuella sunshinyii]